MTTCSGNLHSSLIVCFPHTLTLMMPLSMLAVTKLYIQYVDVQSFLRILPILIWLSIL